MTNLEIFICCECVFILGFFTGGILEMRVSAKHWEKFWLKQLKESTAECFKKGFVEGIRAAFKMLGMEPVEITTTPPPQDIKPVDETVH